MRFNKTVLYITTGHEYTKVVQILLEYSTKVDAQSQNSSTALYLAADYRDIKVVPKLLEYRPNVNILDNSSMTTLYQLVYN